MATLVVKRSIMHRYQRIEDAIRDAEPGDFIEIRDGIYEESFEISKRLTLYGVGNVTIKGGVFIRYNRHANMRNLRFTQGQGIYVKGDLQLENCVIEQQLVQTQVTVSFGSLMMKNVDILAGPVNHYGLHIDNGSSVILVDTTIQHHTKAQIMVQNSEISLTNCMLLEGQTNGIFAIRNVKIDIVNCEIHGHQQTQIVAAASTMTMTNTLIHQGQDLGIQLLDQSTLTMDGCEIKRHLDTNLVVHNSEVWLMDSIFSDGQGHGIYIAEQSNAKLFDCKVHEHYKSQLIIENSKAEICKCSVMKGQTTGVTIVNEANVSMSECMIQDHQQFHFIVDASYLKLNQSVLQYGKAGGIFGNDHAKIMLHHTTILELEGHHLYINNARLFADRCTFDAIIGHAITCIKAIFEIANSAFKNNGKQSPYALIWSDKSMGRIKHCSVDEMERTFLALSNQSMLEMESIDLTTVKIPAIVQEKSQLFIQGTTRGTMWKSDDTSKIISISANVNDKMKQMVNQINQAESINLHSLNEKLQIPIEVLQQVTLILQQNNIKKTI
ncbi:right-handed parallel beta-helix repeat-containing protein [Lysinibacillus sp. NPDC047702]|uniref:right-handed parallel beta-helix repeat-containing protein n=1 Tax=unclassified Lysinibacillus TaxID=2636778 RepID=UPI003D02BA15